VVVGHRRGSALAVVAGVVAMGSGVVAVGCGMPQPDTAACEVPPTSVVGAISTRLHADGGLRNARQVTDRGDRVTFVSAELHLREDDADTQGDVLTWVVRDGETIEAVDEHARRESSWARSGYHVGRAAAIESRGCADLLRGDDGSSDCDRTDGGVAPLCALGDDG